MACNHVWQATLVMGQYKYDCTECGAFGYKKPKMAGLFFKAKHLNDKEPIFAYKCVGCRAADAITRKPKNLCLACKEKKNERPAV